MTVTLLLAFVSGIASTLSPCVLPVLPTFLTWVGGVSLEEATAHAHHRRTIYVRLLLFCLALVLVFTLSGLGIGALGSLGRGLRAQTWLLPAAGLLFIAWGLLLLGVFHLPPIRIAHHRLNGRATGWLSALGFGVLFTVMWVPCIGPIYGSILTLAATSGSASHGAALLLSYSLGLAVPFLILGILADRLVGKLRGLARAGVYLRRTIAGLLIVLGVLLATGLFGQVLGWFISRFPDYVPPLA